MPTTRINFSVAIPTELNDQLLDYCNQTSLKKSTVITQALTEYFENKNNKKPKGGRK